MALTLNHYSIRTTNIDACRDFYANVLGLTVGPRPTFPFPGAWMYRGDHADYANAVVHIIGVDKQKTDGLQDYLGAREETAAEGTGPIDHIAFNTDGLAAMLAHLNAGAVPFRERTVPGIGLHQLFLHDPLGIMVELNYPASEKAAVDAAAALAAAGAVAAATVTGGPAVSATDAAA